MYRPLRRDVYEDEAQTVMFRFNPRRDVSASQTEIEQSIAAGVLWFQSQAGCIGLSDAVVIDAQARYDEFQSQAGCIGLSDYREIAAKQATLDVSIPGGMYRPLRREGGAVYRLAGMFQSQAGCIGLSDRLCRHGII